MGWYQVGCEELGDEFYEIDTYGLFQYDTRYVIVRFPKFQTFEIGC